MVVVGIFPEYARAKQDDRSYSIVITQSVLPIDNDNDTETTGT